MNPQPTTSSSPASKPDDAQPLTFTSINQLKPPTPWPAQPSTKEVSVNGQIITQQEILSEAQHHRAELADAAVESAARALTVKALFLQEAARLNIDASPERDSQGRVETAEDALIRTLIEQQVSVPTADRAACKRYYRHHQTRFRADTIYEARHILLAADPADKAARTKRELLANTLLRHLLQAPAEFEATALAYSDCPSKEHGGNLGQLSAGSTVSEFEQALDHLPVGEINPALIETRYGFHLVKLERRVQGSVLPFDLVQEKISAWLEASSWSRGAAQYIAVLAGKANITGIDMSGASDPLVQ